MCIRTVIANIIDRDIYKVGVELKVCKIGEDGENF